MSINKDESEYIDFDPTTLTQQQIDNAALSIVEILSNYMKNSQIGKHIA